MQSAFAQEKHPNTEPHTSTTSSSSSATHSGTQHTEAPANSDKADQSAANVSHDAHTSQTPAEQSSAKSDAHATDSHAPDAQNAATHGSEHSADHKAAEHSGAHGAAKSGEHGGGHGEQTGYHAPEPYVIDVGGATVHLNTLIATWMVMAILITMAIVATRKLAQKPDTKQIFFESLVDLPHYVIKSQIAHHTARYVPLIGTIFLFILTSNWLGLLPWRVLELFGTPHGFEIAAPTNDLNTNGAIAILVVAAYWFFGIQKKGLAHFKHYVQPMWFLAPLNMMEDISRPLSLSFRLFGNILGGEIVIGILLFLTSGYIVTSLVVIPMFLMEVLVGFIQAFIFSMLTASYIAGMVAEHH